MTIEELYQFLGEFIKQHPKCKDQKIMVKSLADETTWEEVTLVSDTVVSSCPEYGSPIYFHSPSQEAVRQAYINRVNAIEENDYEYYP